MVREKRIKVQLSGNQPKEVVVREGEVITGNDLLILLGVDVPRDNDLVAVYRDEHGQQRIVPLHKPMSDVADGSLVLIGPRDIIQGGFRHIHELEGHPEVKRWARYCLDQLYGRHPKEVPMDVRVRRVHREEQSLLRANLTPIDSLKLLWLGDVEGIEVLLGFWRWWPLYLPPLILAKDTKIKGKELHFFTFFDGWYVLCYTTRWNPMYSSIAYLEMIFRGLD